MSLSSNFRLLSNGALKVGWLSVEDKSGQALLLCCARNL